MPCFASQLVVFFARKTNRENIWKKLLQRKNLEHTIFAINDLSILPENTEKTLKDWISSKWLTSKAAHCYKTTSSHNGFKKNSPSARTLMILGHFRWIYDGSNYCCLELIFCIFGPKTANFQLYFMNFS